MGNGFPIHALRQEGGSRGSQGNAPRHPQHHGNCASPRHYLARLFRLSQLLRCMLRFLLATAGVHLGMLDYLNRRALVDGARLQYLRQLAFEFGDPVSVIIRKRALDDLGPFVDGGTFLALQCLELDAPARGYGLGRPSTPRGWLGGTCDHRHHTWVPGHCRYRCGKQDGPRLFAKASGSQPSAFVSRGWMTPPGTGAFPLGGRRAQGFLKPALSPRVFACQRCGSRTSVPRLLVSVWVTCRQCAKRFQLAPDVSGY